jgi:hypothetical protein
MNKRKKIEQFLRAAPKPETPGGFLDSLLAEVSTRDVKMHRSALRRWFAPTGGTISYRRIAAAAAIAIAVLLSLSYGAARAIRYFTVFEATFDYPNSRYGVSTTVTAKDGTNINNLEDAKQATEEFYKLYKEGKAKEVEPRIWVVTLSNGEEFAYGGDPDQLGLTESERKDTLKKQFDEINELRTAGKYERSFIEEIEKDGMKIRLYRDRFVLSNGKVVTLTTGVEK